MAIAREVEIAARLAREISLPLDRLPYSPHFEAVYTRYVREIGHDCSRHECWWALVDVRKRGLVGSTRRRPPKIKSEI